MTDFPDFDFSAVLEDEAEENGDNGFDKDAAAPITTPPPPENPSQGSNSTVSARKESKSPDFQTDRITAIVNDIGSVDDISGISGCNGVNVPTDFQIAADVEVPMNSNNNNDQSTLDRSPSPSKLMVADEYLNAEELHNEGDEFSSNAQSHSRPPSPDGITNEDRSVARCETCDISFSTKRQRSEHLRDVHGVEKPFKCEHCRARFPYSSSLYNHSRIHSESRPFKCSLCNAAFRWKNSLRHHRLYIHKEEPTSVQIAAKCVLEGKKPAPPSESSGSAEVTKKPPRVKSSSRGTKRSKNGTSAPPFEIDVAKLLSEAESMFANSFPSDNTNGAGTSSAMSASFTPTTGGEGSKRQRKRKPKATFRRTDLSEAVTSDNASGKGHTCGHCEKEFTIWADLVSHIKECAEKEKATLDDTAASSWVSSDDRQENEENEGNRAEEAAQDSDADSDAPGGLIIDQQGSGIRRYSFDEVEQEIDASANFSSGSSSGRSKRQKLDAAGLIDDLALPENDEDSGESREMANGDSDLEQRVFRLEKRLGEVTRTYGARIGALETTVSRLKSQLVRQE